MWVFPANLLVGQTDGDEAGPKGGFLCSCERSVLLFIGKEIMSGSERWHECASEHPLNQLLLILKKKLFCICC